MLYDLHNSFTCRYTNLSDESIIKNVLNFPFHKENTVINYLTQIQVLKADFSPSKKSFIHSEMFIFKGSYLLPIKYRVNFF